MTGPIDFRNVSGEIKEIFASEKAIVSFLYQGKMENALLTNTEFYYEGRRIPGNQALNKYLRIGTSVKFSCEYSNEVPRNHNWNWIARMCWITDNNPLNCISLERGIHDCSGKIVKVEGRHGIIIILDHFRVTHRIMFIASKVYINGKRFSAGKTLSDELFVSEYVSVDAVPCLQEENDEKCSWFATCVFKGRRPKIIHDNHDNNKGHNSSNEITQYENGVQKIKNEFKAKFLNLINQYINHTNCVYAKGKGMILTIIDEELGIIIGEFRKNLFQTILFHRRNFFLFRMCLGQHDLRALLCEKDRVKFVAVGAPSNFPTDWIAIQVSIDECPQY